MKSVQVDEEFAEQILACGQTANGWRALTVSGQTLNVVADKMPEVLAPKLRPWINDYLARIDACIAYYRDNRFDAALAEIDAALALADTGSARSNRGLVLLSLGDWRQGFRDYNGYRRDLVNQSIAGKRVVVAHEGGFGDTIMFSRYVRALERSAAEVVMDVPVELARLLAQLAPIGSQGDVRIPVFTLIARDDAAPLSVPYLKANQDLIHRWDSRLPWLSRRVGIAWSEGHAAPEQYRRSVPLEMLTEVLNNNQLISLQTQQRSEAQRLGVYCPQYSDFADVAAVIALCEEVVSIDTAAINLAGAMAHKATVLLSYSHSWRWKHGGLYPTVRQCCQDAEGDWKSCLVKLRSMKT